MTPILGRLVLLVAILGPGLLAQEPGPKRLFRFAQPVAGDRFVSRASSNLDFRVKVSSEGELRFEVSMSTVEDSTIEREVLTSGEKGATRLRHRLARKVGRRTMATNGEESETKAEDPRLGESYLVELKDGRLIVTGETGEAVTEEIRGLFERDCRKQLSRGLLHDPSAGLGRLLDRKSLGIGDQVDMGADMARDMLQGAEDQLQGKDLEVETARLELLRFEQHAGRDCAVFRMDLAIVGRNEQPGNSMTLGLKLAGEFLVGVEDCWLHRAESKGPMTVTGGRATPGGEAVIAGKGDLRRREEIEIRRPRQGGDDPKKEEGR
ncbi:MAG: hypothetical protein H6807_08060 [Planctomycetes bacterium]|nr:hypothetical protein [Planctomycetota bacterium]